MPQIIEMLKTVDPRSTLKFDDGCNAAVRANNEAICAEDAAVEKPEAGGNIAKFKEMQDGQDPKAHEYSFFKYEGTSAEELVALLLYQDYDRQAAAKVKAPEGDAATGEVKPEPA